MLCRRHVIRAMAAGDYWIEWLTDDGAEHDECWASLDAFLSWAAGESLHGQYRCYCEDEDGDRLLHLQGDF